MTILASSGRDAMRSDGVDAAAAERRRILAEYDRRARAVDADIYALSQPAAALSYMSSRRLATRMLHKAGVFPTAASQCLEIGYGSKGWLPDLIGWGVPSARLHGVELDDARARVARELLPGADLRTGDASALPWDDGAFNLVIVSTVFTSILSVPMRRDVAREIVRVLAPGGALLWYDFSVNNPSNPHVRKVTRAELRQLFPDLRGKMQSVTLAPPLARAVAPRSWIMACVLEACPPLRTHLMAVLVKQKEARA